MLILSPFPRGTSLRSKQGVQHTSKTNAMPKTTIHPTQPYLDNIETTGAFSCQNAQTEAATSTPTNSPAKAIQHNKRRACAIGNYRRENLKLGLELEKNLLLRPEMEEKSAEIILKFIQSPFAAAAHIPFFGSSKEAALAISHRTPAIPSSAIFATHSESAKCGRCTTSFLPKIQI